jgi:hypothetical protein
MLAKDNHTNLFNEIIIDEIFLQDRTLTLLN